MPPPFEWPAGAAITTRRVGAGGTMEFATLEMPGADAVRRLNELRARYAETGDYPFLIGDADELERIQESAECDQEPAEVIRASLDIKIADWIARKRAEAAEYAFSAEETLGQWP